MLCPDVNVLLYAFRRDNIDHSRYAQWLQNAMTGQEPVGKAYPRDISYIF